MSAQTVAPLPPGWRVTNLSEVADVILGQAPNGSSYNEDATGMPLFQGKAEFGDLYPVVRKWTTEPRKVALTGDVLLSVRAPVGPTNLAPFECAIGRGLAAIRARDGIASRYLLYALRATEQELGSEATGTTFAAVSGSQVRAHKIAVAPSSEQDRIVAAIDEYFSHVDAGDQSIRSR